MALNKRTKAARELLEDIDYINKLSPYAQEWLEVFLRATVNLEDDAIAVLAGPDDCLHPTLRKQLYDEDNRRRRDVTYSSAALKHGRSRYSPSDYMRHSVTESDIVDAIDVLLSAQRI